jgi:DNA-binding LytR/AlgR family response regulator
MFKIILICLGPTFILRLYDVLNELRHTNDTLLKERKRLLKQLGKYEENDQNRTITFVSENSSEQLDLLLSDIALIKSADNYVEIIYKQAGDFKKKLMRNTLRNIEQQIKQYANFIRCHRTCIINMNYVKGLKRKYNNYWLYIKDFIEQIPVSRQYLMLIKEALPNKWGE